MRAGLVLVAVATAYFFAVKLVAMPRFSLRTLIVVMLLGGPALAGAWYVWKITVQLDRTSSVSAWLAVANVAILFWIVVRETCDRLSSSHSE